MTIPVSFPSFYLFVDALDVRLLPYALIRPYGFSQAFANFCCLFASVVMFFSLVIFNSKVSKCYNLLYASAVQFQFTSSGVSTNHHAFYTTFHINHLEEAG